MGEKYHVVSVIGDGALTGGMAYEALNNAAELKTNFIIIINDNNMSISKNVGGMSTYLSALRTAETYTGMKIGVTKTLKKIPHVGTAVVDTVRKTKSSIKQLIIPGMLFENMGLTYLGPVDGHNMRQMMKLFNEAKRVEDRLLSMSLQKKAEAMDRHLPIRSVFTEQVLLTFRVADPLQQKQRRHIRIIFLAQYVLWQRRTER